MSPPRPLILAGWVYSNDVEKAERWARTVEWAGQRGWAHLVPELLPDDEYRVHELTSYDVGPDGGPCYRSWNFEPRERPHTKSIHAALERLRSDWTEIAGPVASLTRPTRFSGRKSRRLLVEVVGEGLPPWGTWDTLSGGAARREFTRLRAAVNAVVAPLEVDHIDFWRP